jgi:hypothetical protein
MTRQHRKRLEATRVPVEASQTVVKTTPGLPGRGAAELRELLVAKTALQAELQGLQRKPVLVSVDVLKDRWIFVVRGCKPPWAWWGEYPIFWINSGQVWSETLKLR